MYLFLTFTQTRTLNKQSQVVMQYLIRTYFRGEVNFAKMERVSEIPLKVEMSEATTRNREVINK